MDGIELNTRILDAQMQKYGLSNLVLKYPSALWLSYEENSYGNLFLIFILKKKENGQ